MQVNLVPITESDTIVLRNLWQFYEYDSCKYQPSEVDERGLFAAPEAFLESIGSSNSENTAFTIEVDGKIAGFLVIERAEVEGRMITEFADIFVLPRYRRQGVATSVFQRVVVNSSIPWLLAVFRKDTEALAFWKGVFAREAGLQYRENSPPEIQEFHEFIVNESDA